ncbi:disease resistance-responsive (dirigent-like protein) family protein [Artemisia annua]|uniref:Dirigent protein n=1 Tax=Artemisia annua TaxID=35608 RepID=A0A2U1MUZ6_ARTAN|nr:disease resistance-responsive (dirigent-like protein) family protein [Artemisia annua]
MAKIFFYFILLFIMALSQTISITRADPAFLQSIKKNPMKLKTEKLSHFKFYWHDIVSGPNPTAVTIVQPLANKTKNPLTGFGLINMIDDPLTEKPETESKLLGRAQGFYGASSQEEIGLLMAMNFVFLTGKYNGSTITIMGQNFATRKVREMSVIGGSGVFRFARGGISVDPLMGDRKLCSIVFLGEISSMDIDDDDDCMLLSMSPFTRLVHAWSDSRFLILISCEDWDSWFLSWRASKDSRV